MINLDSTEVHSRTLAAIFDTKVAADKAVRDLAGAGIPREHLSKVAEERTQTVSDKVRHTEIEIEDERGTVKRNATSTVGAIPKARNPNI